MRQVFVAILLFAAVACTKKENTGMSGVTLYQKNMTKVEGSVSVRVNDTAFLTVYYPYSNGCDVVTRFESTKQNNIIFIKAMGGYPAESICTQDAGIKTKTYPFVASTAGTYELRFLNRDGTYLFHSVQVN